MMHECCEYTRTKQFVLKSSCILERKMTIKGFHSLGVSADVETERILMVVADGAGVIRLA